MVSRWTETLAWGVEARDEWMQRRIRYFGKACLTTQEYRAVVYSLHGLPEVTLSDGEVQSDLALPTQKYVATKMGISQSRVSHLLASASMALLWFEDQGTPGIGWVRLSRGRGAAKWDFRAPVLDRPIPKEQRPATSVHKAARSNRPQKCVFAGYIS